MITITETDEASNQEGTTGGEARMTAEVIMRSISDEVMVRLLSQAGDRDLPTEREIELAESNLIGPSDRNKLILFLRQNKIDDKLAQIERDRHRKEYLRGHGIK